MRRPDRRAWLLLAGLLPLGAIAGDFMVTPTDLEFGDAFVGEEVTLAITITNVSGAEQSPQFSGGAPLDSENFGGSQNCAGVTLPPGGSCHFTYRFRPASEGPKATSTKIGIDAESYPITMSGTGLFPYEVAPAWLDFGAVAVGASHELPVVITNLSAVEQSPAFAGGAPFDHENFGGWQNCAGVTLPPDGSCLFTYVFHPVAIGGPIESYTGIWLDGRNFRIDFVGYGVSDRIFADGFQSP